MFIQNHEMVLHKCYHPCLIHAKCSQKPQSSKLWGNLQAYNTHTQARHLSIHVTCCGTMCNPLTSPQQLILTLMLTPPNGSVRWSAHAMRSLSGVAGESIWNQPSMPASFLAAYTASFKAKNTEAPRKNGGSPIALDEYTIGRRWLGESLRRVTQKSKGMSLAEGILYVPAHIHHTLLLTTEATHCHYLQKQGTCLSCNEDQAEIHEEKQVQGGPNGHCMATPRPGYIMAL